MGVVEYVLKYVGGCQKDAGFSTVRQDRRLSRQNRRPDLVNTLFALGHPGPRLELLGPVRGDCRSPAEVSVTECVRFRTSNRTKLTICIAIPKSVGRIGELTCIWQLLTRSALLPRC